MLPSWKAYSSFGWVGNLELDNFTERDINFDLHVDLFSDIIAGIWYSKVGS
jgi:hypothetical protein